VSSSSSPPPLHHLKWLERSIEKYALTSTSTRTNNYSAGRSVVGAERIRARDEEEMDITEAERQQLQVIHDEAVIELHVAIESRLQELQDSEQDDIIQQEAAAGEVLITR
jgi:hypothetical protein